MNEVCWDPIGSTEKFPFFHDLCEELRKTYSLPIKYHYDVTTGNGRPGIPDKLYESYMSVVQKTKEWLNTYYTEECAKLVRSYREWRSTRPNPPEKGLEAFLQSEAASVASHDGNPGFDWFWDHSNPGKMQLLTPALCKAYNIVSQNGIIPPKSLAQKKREADDEIAYQSILLQLKASLKMRYYQEIKFGKGKRPAEILPGFDPELIQEIKTKYNQHEANRIFTRADRYISRAKFELRDMADRLMENYLEEEKKRKLEEEKKRKLEEEKKKKFEEEEKKKWEEEERKALILARAMIQAKEEKKKEKENAYQQIFYYPLE